MGFRCYPLYNTYTLNFQDRTHCQNKKSTNFLKCFNSADDKGTIIREADWFPGEINKIQRPRRQYCVKTFKTNR